MLITSVLQIAELEKQALDAGLGPTLSPELSGNIAWVLTKISEIYIMFHEPYYEQVSVPLVVSLGKEGEGARWLVRFTLEKVLSNFHGWSSESSVLEMTAQLLVALMKNENR